MTWSYVDSLTAAKDQVRVLIGDTDASVPLIQDEEINFFIAQEPNNIYAAGAMAAAKIGLSMAAKADKSIGDLHISHTHRAQVFSGLAANLRRRAERESAPIAWAGSISPGEKEANDSNPSVVKGYFARGMMDNVQAGRQTNDQRDLREIDRG